MPARVASERRVFFSSRRRHTRFDCDWSSDVCSSDLWAKSEHGPVSAPDFRDWHDQSTAFEAMAYYQDRDTAITAGTLAEYGQVAMVSREFFQVFHVQPAIEIGRASCRERV